MLRYPRSVELTFLLAYVDPVVVAVPLQLSCGATPPPHTPPAAATPPPSGGAAASPESGAPVCSVTAPGLVRQRVAVFERLGSSGSVASGAKGAGR